MHLWCGDSCPAWSHLLECQHRFFYPNTKRVTRWQHRSTGVGKASCIRWNLCRGKWKENKTSGHWKWRDRRGLFSAFWAWMMRRNHLCGFWRWLKSISHKRFRQGTWRHFKSFNFCPDRYRHVAVSQAIVLLWKIYFSFFFLVFFLSCNLVCVCVCACLHVCVL